MKQTFNHKNNKLLKYYTIYFLDGPSTKEKFIFVFMYFFLLLLKPS